MREQDWDRAAADSKFSSPMGPLWLAATEKGICAISFEPPGEGARSAGQKPASPVAAEIMKKAESALSRYFAGDPKALENVPVDAAGTEFQRSVWEALRRIPSGQTRSYGEIARLIGRPRAVRAVGAANGSNPVPIVVPCHRVIGANGTLTGYGGGLERKEWLLTHERSGRVAGKETPVAARGAKS
jgi:methylated-DNA-[protein]-cysteine S-methyltransferase